MAVHVTVSFTSRHIRQVTSNVPRSLVMRYAGREGPPRRRPYRQRRSGGSQGEAGCQRDGHLSRSKSNLHNLPCTLKLTMGVGNEYFLNLTHLHVALLDLMLRRLSTIE